MPMHALMLAFLETGGDLEVVVGVSDVAFEQRAHVRHHHLFAQLELVGPEARGPLAIADVDALQS